MFCEYCGTKSEGAQKFCDSCGKSASGTSSTRLVKFKISPYTVGLILLAVMALSFFLMNRQNQNRLAEELRLQKNQTKDLLVQIQNNQDENSKVKKELSEQLEQQKAESAKTSQDLAAAQRRLSQQQTSAPVKTSSDLSLPDVNTKAIVMIVCFDSSGNAQAGSGVVIGSAGYVLTNKHVVTDRRGSVMNCAMVMRENNNSSPLKSDTAYMLTINEPNTGLFSYFDAAILKVYEARSFASGQVVSMPTSFPYIKPSPGNLKQGDAIYILGYPGASNHVFSVFRGIVSSFSDNGIFINTDAVIDQGNSGGAAFTSDGRFVGIPTQRYQHEGDYLGQILDLNILTIPNF